VGPWKGKGQRPDLVGQRFGRRLCLGSHSDGEVPPLWVPWGLLSWMYKVGVKTLLGSFVEPGQRR
jgi:hypothetical protein